MKNKHSTPKKPKRTDLNAFRQATIALRDIAPAGAGFPNGHVVEANFVANPGVTIDHFEATFTTPSYPTQNSRQSIYLYIGLQTQNWLVQCTFQWGHSRAGGDYDFWYLVCMVVNLDPTVPVQTAISGPVQANTTFKATINRASAPAGGNIYTMAFDDGTTLASNPINEVLDTAAVALETYGVQSSADYPANTTSSFSRIAINNGGIQPNWTDNSSGNSNGEQVLINTARPDTVGIQFR
jgi:hypothetical protein